LLVEGSDHASSRQQTIPWQQKFRITNWSTYNKALINRGSLTFWLDDEAIQAGMSRQRLHHEEGPSAILISPSPPFW
jgi:hypothetical protein